MGLAAARASPGNPKSTLKSRSGVPGASLAGYPASPIQNCRFSDGSETPCVYFPPQVGET